MFLTRFIGRSLLAAARSQSTAVAARSHSTATAAAAGASTATSGHNPLEEFFEKERTPDDQKPVYGRSWKACELRLKSWDDLQKLWFVLLKEKNMLMTQRQMLHAQNLRFPNPERIPKWKRNVKNINKDVIILCSPTWFLHLEVRKSMCRIKHVLTERAIDEPDPRRSAEMKRMINAL
ncbi:hypothetical protein Ddye_002394 [Dipteronia dyeriana]|uniref:Large ribosomal subunit protein uL29m n=1 Tax=Dipteronia dyeriana TaxID=168575 RepID=A0AAE0CUC5_9ROSI|nr:hypothetical protein Ddye_002394 [Dipteronia dyeriana]